MKDCFRGVRVIASMKTLLNTFRVQMGFLLIIIGLTSAVRTSAIRHVLDSNNIRQCDNEFKGIQSLLFPGINNFIKYNLTDHQPSDDWYLEFTFKTKSRDAALLIMETGDNGNKVGLFMKNGSLQVLFEVDHAWLEECNQYLSGLVNKGEPTTVKIEFESPDFIFTTPFDEQTKNVGECFKETPNLVTFLFGGIPIHEEDDQMPPVYDSLKGRIWDMTFNDARLQDVTTVDDRQNVEEVLDKEECPSPFLDTDVGCRCPEGQIAVNDHCKPSCKCRECQNGGTCQDKNDNTWCNCSVGFSGTACGNIVDTCLNDSCHQHGKCERNLTQENGILCICDEGYEGQYCDKQNSDSKGFVGEYIAIGICVLFGLIGLFFLIFTCREKRKKKNLPKDNRDGSFSNVEEQTDHV